MKVFMTIRRNTISHVTVYSLAFWRSTRKTLSKKLNKGPTFFTPPFYVNKIRSISRKYQQSFEKLWYKCEPNTSQSNDGSIIFRNAYLLRVITIWVIFDHTNGHNGALRWHCHVIIGRRSTRPKTAHWS